MKDIEYRSFSLRTHKNNWRMGQPNTCQFELTFACGLHCRHCYTDCYNHPPYLKKELKTQEIKLILDKVYQAGAIWLCLTGGDPLSRKDFLDIYSYAKRKGFIVTVFTNAYSMTGRIAAYLKKEPPFVFEVTLNAYTKETYEKISRVKGSFEKAREGIKLILRNGIPLKIKTQITRDNFQEVPGIKKIVEGLGLKFRPSYNLTARLDYDSAPCNLRVSPRKALGLGAKSEGRLRDECVLHQEPEGGGRNPPSENLFTCAVGGSDGIHVDPYGNTFACNFIRKPALNLLKNDVGDAMRRLSSEVRNRKFLTGSKCNGCHLRQECCWCPGRAYLETGDIEKPIDYYCRMAHLANRL